jgi:hypothetical protein
MVSHNKIGVAKRAEVALGLADVDGRTLIARRFRDISGAISDDLGADPSQAQVQLIRRAATLSVWCEQAEAKMAAGDELPLVEYISASTALARILDKLGLERVPREVPVTLESYLAAKTASPES